MALQNIPIPLTGGHDRSAAPLAVNPASFYRLHNLRQNPDSPGRIEQTHPFYIHFTVPPGPGELATSAVRRIIKPAKLSTGYIVFTDSSIYNQEVPERVPTYHMGYSPIPTGPGDPVLEPVYQMAMMTFSPSTAFNIPVGEYYEVQVMGPSTFRARALSTGIWSPVLVFDTAGKTIPGTGDVLYTLFNTGYRTGDVWRWFRSDRVSNSGNPGDILDLVQYKDTVYFINADEIVMKLVWSSLNHYYCVTAGYTLLTARHLSIFEDHLFLHPGGMLNDGPLENFVANSDITDLDQFVSTDVNEADSYDIPVNTTFPFAENEVTGGGVVNTRLFITTESGIWYTDYIGLPIPFSFKKLRDFPGIIRTMTGLDCLYFYTNDGRLYRFDGTSITSFGANYFPLLTPTTEIWDVSIDRQDLVQYFFDRGNKTLLANDHSRSLDFPSGAPYCVSNLGDALYVGTANLRVLKEDRDLTHVPVPETGVPQLITQPIVGAAVNSAKELNGVFVGVDRSVVRGPDYAIDDDIRVAVEYYNTDTGIPITPVAGGTWTPNVEQNFVDVRTAFKALLLQLTIYSKSVLPPAGIALTSLNIEGVNLSKSEPIKK